MIHDAPDDIGLAFGRACCLEDLGRIDEAVQAYVAVLNRQPTHFGGLTNLGSLLFEHGRAADARPYVLAAAKLFPADPIALVNLALLQADSGDVETAMATYASV